MLSLGDALCARMGRSSSASLVQRCASVSSGGRGLAGACRSSCGPGFVTGACLRSGAVLAWLTIASGPQQCLSDAQRPSVCCSLLYGWWSLSCFCGHPSLDMAGKWASLLGRCRTAPRARDPGLSSTDWARGGAQGRVPPGATVWKLRRHSHRPRRTCGSVGLVSEGD